MYGAFLGGLLGADIRACPHLNLMKEIEFVGRDPQRFNGTN
jgi:hypothetical protein